MELEKSKTILNLAKAFAGECMARARYEYIEYGARQQGHTALAEVVDKIAYNEFNHSRMFYSFIQSAGKRTIDNIDVQSGYPFREKWDLTENLRLAAEDELDEAEKVYPLYAETARKEGFSDVAGLFENIIEVEKQHAKTFQKLHEAMKNGTLYSKKSAVTWTCGGCGYSETGKKAFETCPLCQAKQGVVCLQPEDTGK